MHIFMSLYGPGGLGKAAARQRCFLGHCGPSPPLEGICSSSRPDATASRRRL